MSFVNECYEGRRGEDENDRDEDEAEGVGAAVAGPVGVIHVQIPASSHSGHEQLLGQEEGGEQQVDGEAEPRDRVRVERRQDEDRVEDSESDCGQAAQDYELVETRPSAPRISKNNICEGFF